ncbi:hypothetical protein DFH28DRAFT_853508, partial [Melampsora americana]
MHSHTYQPCIRAKLLSAFNLVEKRNKDLGIPSINLKDQCDPLFTALARSNNTLTSHRYACQRAAKVPIRVPAGSPINHKFSKISIYTSEDVEEEIGQSGDEGILASEQEIHPKVQRTMRPQLVNPEIPSPILGSENYLLDWLLFTSITEPEEDENSMIRVPSALGSRGIVSSSCNTEIDIQSAGSTPDSYLTTSVSTLSSTGRGDHSSETPSPSTGMIQKPSRIKR